MICVEETGKTAAKGYGLLYLYSSGELPYAAHFGSRDDPVNTCDTHVS